MSIAPIATVDVLFFNKEKTKTLLFKRTNEPLKGVYFSMGGRIRKGEKFIDCAVRQVREEVGLHIKKSGLVFGGVQEEIHKNSAFKGISYHAVGIFYGYILEGENITLDAQHNEYRWFSVTDKTLHPFIKTKLKSLFQNYHRYTTPKR